MNTTGLYYNEKLSTDHFYRLQLSIKWKYIHIYSKKSLMNGCDQREYMSFNSVH